MRRGPAERGAHIRTREIAPDARIDDQIVSGIAHRDLKRVSMSVGRNREIAEGADIEQDAPATRPQHDDAGCLLYTSDAADE